MVRAPQRGWRADYPVSRLSIPLDLELKYDLKRVALDARVSVTRFVTHLIEETVSGAGHDTEAQGSARGRGGDATLDMNIDPDLHRDLKSAALDAVTVTGYVTSLIEGAVRGAGSQR